MPGPCRWAAGDSVRGRLAELARLDGEVVDPRGEDDVTKLDVRRGTPTGDADDEYEPGAEIVDQVPRRVLRLALALLDQAQHGDPVALATAGIGVAQRVLPAGALKGRRPEARWRWSSCLGPPTRSSRWSPSRWPSNARHGTAGGYALVARASIIAPPRTSPAAAGRGTGRTRRLGHDGGACARRRAAALQRLAEPVCDVVELEPGGG